MPNTRKGSACLMGSMLGQGHKSIKTNENRCCKFCADPLTGVASNGMSRTLFWGLIIPGLARLRRFARRGVATDLNDSSDAIFFSFRLGLSRCRLSWFNLRFPASFRWLCRFCLSSTLPWSSTLSGTSTLLIADASPLFAVLKVRMKTMQKGLQGVVCGRGRRC